MAYASTTTSTKSFADTLGGFFNGILQGLLRIAETNSRVKAIEQLNSMSDAQLAARGLKREDIVRHIFSDMLYV